MLLGALKERIRVFYKVINAQRLEKVKLGQAPGALQGANLDS
jgi:hypothetical protein